MLRQSSSIDFQTASSILLLLLLLSFFLLSMLHFPLQHFLDVLSFSLSPSIFLSLVRSSSSWLPYPFPLQLLALFVTASLFVIIIFLRLPLDIF